MKKIKYLINERLGMPGRITMKTINKTHLSNSRSFILFFIFFLVFLISSPLAAHAGPASLVKDINAFISTVASDPSHFTDVNGTVFFYATDVTSGTELWKSDGTAEGTVLVKDSNPGPAGSKPADLKTFLVNVNGTLFFTAKDELHGTELWRSNGTGAGTVMVKDIYPGLTSSSIAELTDLNGTLLFSADDGANGIELWKSDGTEAGTVLVKDIYTGGSADSSNPSYLTNVNGTLFFAADDGLIGNELWISDGTTAGTVNVTDNLFPGPEGSYPEELTNINGTLYFRALYDDVDYYGVELWKSDGTDAGTVMIANINTFEAVFDGSSHPTQITLSGGNIYFIAADDVDEGDFELWVTDGVPITDPPCSVFPFPPCWDPYADPPTSGTHRVKNIGGTSGAAIDNMIDQNGTLLFTANGGSSTGLELWKSTDGTLLGTDIVKDIFPGPTSSSPSDFEVLNGTLFFAANDGTNGKELWSSDGTTLGTNLFKDINSGSGDSSPASLTNVSGLLYFAADDGTNGVELWTSDGVPANTQMLKNIVSTTDNAYVDYITEMNGKVYFAADDGISGVELWESDGTAPGTVMVKDIYTGTNCGVAFNEPCSSSPIFLTNVNGTLFFAADDGSTGYELWKSDGTALGTVRVKDIYSGITGSNPSYLASFNGKVYFAADDGASGTELFVSDGTSGGTQLVANIVSGSGNSFPEHITSMGGTLYFAADDGVNGVELWESDGIVAGTTQLAANINGAADSFPSYLTDVGGTLYFAADDGSNGEELWSFNGATASIVLDINTGSGSSFPSHLENVNGTLYFGADDGTNGVELWTSDGTGPGTVIVDDKVPGAGDLIPEYITGILNYDWMVFSGYDLESGIELWNSDGSVTGTRRLQDISPGALSSSPSNFTVAGANVYFVANDSTTGTELWSMPVSIFEFGKISGQVTKDTGEPFPGIQVEVFDGSMTKIGEAYTDIFGHYIVTDLIARPDYVARANGTGGYITQTVTAITVTVPDYTIVDFVLAPGGDISGNITDFVSGSPIANVTVSAYNSVDPNNWIFLGSTTTDALGDYYLAGVPVNAVGWLVEADARDQDYVRYYHDGVIDPEQFTPVPVNLGVPTPNIDFSLIKGGSISGYVSDGFSPVDNIHIIALSQNNEYLADTYTDPSGNYSMLGVLPGDVVLECDTSGTPFIPQYYTGVYEWRDVTLVNVVESVNTSGRDFTLSLGGILTGTLTVDSSPPLDAWVSLFSVDQDRWLLDNSVLEGNLTDVFGSWEAVVPPGEYKLWADAEPMDTYPPRFYDNKYLFNNATSVTVTGTETHSNLDIDLLSTKGTIQGTATYPDATVTGDVVIWISNGTGKDFPNMSNGTCCGLGAYSMIAAPGGTWYVKAFIDVDSDLEYDFWEPFGEYAGSVTVTSGGTFPGIDIVIDDIPPTVTTNTASNIEHRDAVLHSTVNPNYYTTDVWYEWDTDSGVPYANTTAPTINIGNGIVPVSSPATDQFINALLPGTTYYYRAVASNSGGTTYGTELSFNTLFRPTVTTDPATLIDSTSATLNGRVNPWDYAPLGDDPTSAYFQWGTTIAYGNVTGTVAVANGIVDDPQSAVLITLSPGTEYHFRMVGIDADEPVGGAAYGADDVFFTEPSPPSNVTFSMVYSDAMTIDWVNGSNTTALVVVRDGSPVTAAPTDGNDYTGPDYTSFGSGPDLGAGTFQYVVFAGSGSSVTITNLVSGNTYYVAVYAFAGSGTDTNYLESSPATGSQTTAVPPTLSGTQVSNIDITEATLIANIDNAGNSDIIDRGTVWNTSGDAFDVAVDNNILPDCVGPPGSCGIGGISQIHGGMTAGTQIFYAGYASNLSYTSYSTQGSFYTEPNVPIGPISFSAITSSSMTINWNYDGTAAGAIVVMNAVNPVDVDPADGTDYSLVSNSVFGDGASDISGNNYVVFAGAGTSVNVTNLTKGTTYYVKVYTYSGSGDDGVPTIYDKGINYQHDGALTGFQIAADPPTVQFPSSASIDILSATLGANITDDGGDTVTERGTLWNTSGTPIIENQLAECPDPGPCLTGAFSHPRDLTAAGAGTQVFHVGYATNR
jgi:ELWxxDGT repeat protein